jgi:hypothetical protein
LAGGARGNGDRENDGGGKTGPGHDQFLSVVRLIAAP